MRVLFFFFSPLFLRHQYGSMFRVYEPVSNEIIKGNRSLMVFGYDDDDDCSFSLGSEAFGSSSHWIRVRTSNSPFRTTEVFRWLMSYMKEWHCFRTPFVRCCWCCVFSLPSLSYKGPLVVVFFRTLCVLILYLKTTHFMNGTQFNNQAGKRSFFFFMHAMASRLFPWRI